MSRQIQIGDLALINDVPYYIREIRDGYIFISETPDDQDLSALYPNASQQWKVFQYNVPHTVTFQKVDQNTWKVICSVARVGRAGEDRFVNDTNDKYTLIGIFDGHGGDKVVNELEKDFPTLLRSALNGVNLNNDQQVEQTINNLFINIDKQILDKLGQRDQSGATATVAILTPTKIHLSNLGDSRGIVYDSMGNLLLATSDHKPDLEKERIEAEGGSVIHYGCPRVDGILAVCRAFGDYALKRGEQPGYKATGRVTVMPEHYHLNISQPDIRVLIASDGLWDVYSSQAIVDMSLEGKSCEDLASMAKSGTTDDITIIKASD